MGLADDHDAAGWQESAPSIAGIAGVSNEELVNSFARDTGL